ncbi:addiction module protein [Urbifossiella limnaea]|uniref:Uncharacterized protein n=1 Tax=Urbifossiella limnaea TaxID=2528023 RepID=A0A517XY88_9BACT|nr:addiction module protein [Urbifossiella limnaea]QDU22475.1 hypothetical protein ETAA1_44550 [Urbifossiella limnaea]
MPEKHEPLPPLTDAKRQELARRLADADANPGDVVPWEVVEAAARARFDGSGLP